MTVIITKEIRTNLQGFMSFLELYNQIRNHIHRDSDVRIDINFQHKWFDANMCSSLGALLHKYETEHGATFKLLNMRQGTQEIMQRNGFLQQFGNYPELQNGYGTTIRYARFDRDQSREFRDYIEQNFYRGARGLPEMTQQLLSKFRESIGELFDNAIEHSETEMGIFVCGQLFPRNKKLLFSVVDLGIGFSENIRKYLNREFSAEEAIEWALEGSNTTRSQQKKKPGGFGLKLIKQFIALNKGRIIIVSDAGYYEMNSGVPIAGQKPTTITRLNGRFPGSAISFEINTADTHRYDLAPESDIDLSDIF